MKTLYDTLEVSPNACHLVIQAAYRCLAQHDHPDKNADSIDSGQRMTNINRAYAVLSNPTQRCSYDRSLGLLRKAGDRRGLGSSAAASHMRQSTVPPTVRLFAFRPLT